ncbi:MAG: ABC transporter ATP-binding protein [Hungatella hathewayi]|nr:ABC transporter ATP-binding protein [Hungatella hathewayi]
MGTIILEAVGITKAFDKQEMILKGISLEIAEKSFVVLLGPSGSGKTTLLNIMSGLLRPTGGIVRCGERVITEFGEKELARWKRSRTGNIFQNYLLLRNLTVRENIEIGMAPGGENLDFVGLVEMLELGDVLDKFPAQLSGGQKQRTAIARAVIKRPEILFCDEATGALDEANSKKVVKLLHGVKENYGVTVIFVTHNLQIARTADRVLTIKDGLLWEDRLQEHPIGADEMVWG